ncbi:helix-turn-helix domain-containing protein [Carnobacterium maltaromaticum]|uniref:helix-turn-helix domain-containing protein n=1 Tax=Carnobacterium maltaromaticum TaxID=2751 RepID=UPI0012FCF5D6|nr:helix-turn-helix transcriptional regulator [Carnobacterium maltaromaticum]
MSQFGTRLKELRLSKKMSQEDLAKILGMKRENVSHYERGLTTNVPSDVLEKVSNYFNVSADYLLGRETSTLTGKDAIDFKDFMDNSVDMTFFGEDMTEAEMQRLKDIMIATFFEKLEERKNKENNSNGK